MTDTELTNLNRLLHGMHGSYEDGRAKWRVSLAGKEIEKCYGTFNEFYGNIFLRETTGMREMPKYWYLPEESYVLEKLIYSPCWELMGNGLKLSYEPVHRFPTKLQLMGDVWNGCMFIIAGIQDGFASTVLEGRTAKYNEDEHEVEVGKRYDEYANKRLDSLTATPIAHALAHGGGIVVPNSYEE